MIRRIEMPITSRPDAVSRIVHWPSSRLSDLPMAWLRAARWSVAMAKRAYPVIFVFCNLRHPSCCHNDRAPTRDLAPYLGD
jgi:hypothetical protein